MLRKNRDKWTKVDEYIKKMMIGYPSLFLSRRCCQDHLFACIGTGYQWNENGERVYEESLGFEIPKSMKIEEIKISDGEPYIFEKKMVNTIRQCVFENIDIAVKDESHIYYKEPLSILNVYSMEWCDKKEEYSFLFPMQKAVEIKDKLDPDWKEEIVDFCDWIILETHKFIRDTGSNKVLSFEEIIELLSNTKLEKLEKLKNNYIMAANVIKGILTEKEKKERKEFAGGMRNVFNEILKRR